MNVFKTRVSYLPLEGDYYYANLSEFRLLNFVYKNKGVYDFRELTYQHKIGSGYDRIAIAILKKAPYDECAVIRNVSERSFTLECKVEDYYKAGMQIIDCTKRGYIFVIPNWSQDISSISDEALTYVPELERYCIGLESLEIVAS